MRITYLSYVFFKGIYICSLMRMSINFSKLYGNEWHDYVALEEAIEIQTSLNRYNCPRMSILNKTQKCDVYSLDRL